VHSVASLSSVWIFSRTQIMFFSGYKILVFVRFFDEFYPIVGAVLYCQTTLSLLHLITCGNIWNLPARLELLKMWMDNFLSDMLLSISFLWISSVEMLGCCCLQNSVYVTTSSVLASCVLSSPILWLANLNGAFWNVQISSYLPSCCAIQPPVNDILSCLIWNCLSLMYERIVSHSTKNSSSANHFLLINFALGSEVRNVESNFEIKLVVFISKCASWLAPITIKLQIQECSSQVLKMFSNPCSKSELKSTVILGYKVDPVLRWRMH